MSAELNSPPVLNFNLAVDGGAFWNIVLVGFFGCVLIPRLQQCFFFPKSLKLSMEHTESILEQLFLILV